MSGFSLCPVCGKLSRVKKQTVNINGKNYNYLVYEHSDRTHHRLSAATSTPKVSMVNLGMEVIEEFLEKPMKFSELKSLIKEKTSIEIHNQVLSRILKNLVKLGLLNRVIDNHQVYYVRNENNSIRVVIDYYQINLENQSMRGIFIFRNESKVIFNKLLVSLPFNLSSLGNLSFSDSFGRIAPSNYKEIYSTSNESLFDLLHFSPPYLIRRNRDFSNTEYTILIFLGIKENMTISINFE